jgi:hypothetical protein
MFGGTAQRVFGLGQKRNTCQDVFTYGLPEVKLFQYLLLQARWFNATSVSCLTKYRRNCSLRTNLRTDSLYTFKNFLLTKQDVL